MTLLPGLLELRRDALLDRVERAQPKILALIAPAGFGKSTLARQLIIGKSAAICDVSGIADDLDLARRLVPALAHESPNRTRTLTQRELMLGDGGTSVAERVNLALEAWKTPTEQAFFVFENAEHIARNQTAREFFARLLTHRPQGRTVVVCARENLRVHLTRFAAPHEILTLRAEDLAFERSELTRVFHPSAGCKPRPPPSWNASSNSRKGGPLPSFSSNALRTKGAWSIYCRVWTILRSKSCMTT